MVANVYNVRRTVMTAIETDQWITYEHAKRLSGLGRTKLWEIVSTGEVEAAKIGRAVRINRGSLDRYMRRNAYVESRE
jgi:excisionase family DNA binding protein